MKIALVVSDLTFPAKEGLHQQSLSMAAQLIRHGVDVDLYGFTKEANHLDRALMLATMGIDFVLAPISYSGSTLLRGIRHSLPLLPHSQVRRLVDHLLSGGYDVVHLEGVAATPLVFHLSGQKVVLGMVDPGSLRNLRMSKVAITGISRLARLVAAGVFFALEARMSRVKAPWHVVSEDDAAFLRRRHRNHEVWSIPVALPSAVEKRCNRLSHDGVFDSVHVVIYSDLRQRHNRSALGEFISQVLRRSVHARDVHFTVLGRVPASSRLLAQFNGFDVTIVEWAEDYIGVLCSADLVILPDTVGTGIKNRAVQSLALGRAVLGTVVAFEGIPMEGMPGIVARSNAEMLIGFDHMISDPELRKSCGEAGQEFARKSFGSEAVTARWLQRYRNLVEP